jgi:chromosome partitioning protein
MPVITMLSSKGGVGKTTTALILATELAAAGDRVAIVDADPNFPLAKWAMMPGKPDNIVVIKEVDEEEIIATIDEARRHARFVIVDLEGRATARATNALLMSNLVLIPIQGSALDANEAARAFKSVRSVAKARERPLSFSAVLTRAPASERLWSRDLKAVATNLSEAGISIIPTALAERGAFRAMFSLGGTLDDMSDADVASLASAKANARAFARNVLDVLAQGVPA